MPFSTHNLLSEVGIELEDACIIYEDNDGTRRLAMSGMGQKKARYLDRKYHHIQELCREDRVKVVRMPFSTHNLLSEVGIVT